MSSAVTVLSLLRENFPGDADVSVATRKDKKLAWIIKMLLDRHVAGEEFDCENFEELEVYIIYQFNF